jgi:hypothetical protein
MEQPKKCGLCGTGSEPFEPVVHYEVGFGRPDHWYGGEAHGNCLIAENKKKGLHI